MHNHHERIRNQIRYEFKALQESLMNRLRDIEKNSANQNRQQIEDVSQECQVHVANTTIRLESLEKSMQDRIVELEKKIAENLEKIRHMNETCDLDQSNSEGFEMIGQKHYRIENLQKLSWYEASKMCRQYDSHLAALQDVNELQELRGRLSESDYWLDLNDLKVPQEFRVVYTGLEASLLLWGPGEPKNIDGNAHCVDLQRLGTDYAMSTKGCDLQYSYICEKVIQDECDDSWTP